MKRYRANLLAQRTSLLLSVCFLVSGITAKGDRQYPGPSSRQLAWQAREVEALVHFGPNTFTGQEWGTGKEDPGIFNPTDLDARQWVEVAQSFNAKAVILVTKHHDGFALWPSKYTEHSVKRSPWKKGKGDVVREVSEACREAGIGFGVYLSPGDRHEPSYGRDSERYNDFFCNQLTELLSNYGEITQVFFDGARPVRDRTQDYDWQRYYRLIRKLQPNAVIAVRGSDVRWVGNEHGVARPDEWSVIPLPVAPEKFDWRDMTGRNLGWRNTNARFLHWYPAVADVSVRSGWFWKPQTDGSVKSPDELMRIYENSVGRNAGLQINIAPDARGRIPDGDAAALKEFGERVRKYFAVDLAAGDNAHVMDSEDRLGRRKKSVAFSTPVQARYLVLQEDISKGQRVEFAEVTVTTSSGQRLSYPIKSIGWKRIIELREEAVKEIEVTIHKTRGEAHVRLSVY